MTSREPLYLPGEDVVQLAPLTPEDAAALYVDRAGTEHPAAEVEALVRGLDCLPLAVEIAASHGRTLSPARLLARLDGRRTSLRSRRRDRPGRHSSLEAALQWSWDLLQPHERSALAQLSIFRGGASPEAAEAVVDLGGFRDAPWTLFVLESLADKSLLRVEGDGVEARFVPYLGVREWAAGKLPPTELRAAEDRRLAWAVGWADPAIDRALRSRRAARLGAQLVAELPNLHAAFEHARRRRDASGTAATAIAVSRATELVGPFAVGAEACRTALAMPQDAVHNRDLLAALAQLQLAAGDIAALDRTTRELEQAAAAVGDPGPIALARMLRGASAILQGRRQEAEATLRRARREAASAGRTDLEGRALAMLGVTAHGSGDPEASERASQEALTLHRACGDVYGAGVALGNIAAAAVVRGEYPRAKALFAEARDLHAVLGRRRDEAVAELNLAMISAPTGASADTLRDAVAALGRAETKLTRIGDRVLAAKARTYRGLHGMRIGVPESEAIARRGLQWLEGSGNAQFRASAMRDLADLLLRAGRATDALQTLDRSEAVRVPPTDVLASEGAALRGLVLLALDRTEEARSHLRRAERLGASLPSGSPRAERLVRLREALQP